MNGVHDMGGMEGLGALAPETDEPVFHHPWEGRVLALTIASPTRVNIDAGRHQRELIPGPDYLAMTYYEKWFRSLCELVVKQGLASRAELAAGRAAPGFETAAPRLLADQVEPMFASPAGFRREVAQGPAFKTGDTVRGRNLNPPGHTRLPRYVRGRQGEVVRWRGAHVFPDSHAHGLGEDPRHLYTVRFAARELWGETAGPRDSVCLDLWEPYLEHA
ncbi:MAG TPA: nitrile hydratase subunit beta [Phenylobacterium sp.]|nr:nitrile hydratase subunit beta [Phenylobacterium sp.]